MFNKCTPNRTGLKDLWNAYMVEDAVFSREDIPFCPTIFTDMPRNIITWTEAKSIHKKMMCKNRNYYDDSMVCFYIDDVFFDGQRSSIWTFPWEAIRVISHFRGIITPDFSTNIDFPDPICRFNTYRMRAFGFWVGKTGKNVINNVRWGLKDSYKYCFYGIDNNSIVAIGTVGGSPRKYQDRERFENGLFEMVKKLTPKAIIVYGSGNYPCFTTLKKQGIEIMSFPSHTRKAYERRERNE